MSSNSPVTGHFLFGRCVNADAAADLAAALDFGSLSTLAAADAAFALVTSLLDAMNFTPFHRHRQKAINDSRIIQQACLICQADRWRA